MAAWQLAKGGHEVIALEQFRLDHDLGSSYGDSRIVRRVYPDPLYTALMADAYALWDELQARFPEEELFRPIGGLFFGGADHPQVRQAEAALARSGVAHEVLSATECRRRFPAFALRDDEAAVYEPSMGYARASRCVRAAARLASEYGADIREETPVVGIGRDGAGVQATTAHGETLHADRLVINAGAWAGPLLAPLGVDLPLKVTRQIYFHLEPARNAADFEVGRFPAWIDIEANTYGFPRLGEVPGVKLALHSHGEVTAPETVNRTVTDADYAAIRGYAAMRFPDLGDRSLYAKVCLYTNTPDEDFIIDEVPGLPGATLISACSGHGFKFTPLLGRIAATLAAGEPMPFDLARFRLARFASAASRA
jgi:monomeric sarcosine oxidase